MRVATGPTPTRYVFKISSADERECQREKSRRWKNFVVRCNQAEGIRRGVQEREVQPFPGAAQSAVPAAASSVIQSRWPTRDFYCQFQELVSKDRNVHAWRHPTTRRYLDELYAIIDRAGGVRTLPMPSSNKNGLTEAERRIAEATHRGESAPILSDLGLQVLPESICRLAHCFFTPTSPGARSLVRLTSATN